MSALWSPYVLGLLGSIGVLTAVASAVWRHRNRSGGIELIALLLVILSWSVIYAVSLLTLDPSLRSWLERVMWLAIVTVPVAWLKFALVYTGHQHHVNRLLLGSLLMGSLAIAITVLTNPYHGLMWATNEMVVTDGIAVMRQSGGLLQLPALAYLYGIILVGSAVIVRDPLQSGGLYNDQTVVLLIGTGIPMIASMLSVVGLAPIPGMDMTPYAFTISGLAFGYAVLRIDLFEFLPATRTLGRDLAIDHLSEGVFILDPGGRIVDTNDTGSAIFGDRPTGVLGLNLPELLLGDSTVAVTDLPDEVRVNGRLLGLTVSPIHDSTEAPIGHTVVLRDITDRRLRKTQLEVLNRVLRHNLRNKLAIVQGEVDQLADNGHKEHDSIVAINETISELTDLSDRSREFERLKALEGLEPIPVALAEVIEESAYELERLYPSADIDRSIPPDLTVTTHMEILIIVVENLLHNAVVHHDRSRQQVTISGAGDDTGVTIEIVDDGPGIPEEELEVLTSGRETPIQHGSGLGLWVAKWAVQSLRGDIEFVAEDPRGTRIAIDLPNLAPIEDEVVDPEVSSTT